MTETKCEHLHWTMPPADYEIECKACAMTLDIREWGDPRVDVEKNIDTQRKWYRSDLIRDSGEYAHITSQTWSAFNRNAKLCATVEVELGPDQIPCESFAGSALDALNRWFRKQDPDAGERRWCGWWEYGFTVTGAPRYAVYTSRRTGDEDSDEGSSPEYFIHRKCSRGEKHNHATETAARQCPAWSDPGADGIALCCGKTLIRKH